MRLHLSSTMFIIHCATLPIISYAAETYDSEKNYSGGHEVCYQQDLYKAKWWANPKQSPSEVATVTHPWDTPWKIMESTATACGTEGGENRAPQAEATASPLNLSGSGIVNVSAQNSSDIDGDVLSYLWTQIPTGAPVAIINEASSANTQLELASVTTPHEYRFLLTVSDGLLSSAAEVIIHQQPAIGNQAPVSSASASTASVTGNATITLDGIASYDADGDELQYTWLQTAPASPLATITSANMVTTLVTLPAPNANTQYQFQLIVSDGALSGSSNVTISQYMENNPGADCDAASFVSGSGYNDGDKVTHQDASYTCLIGGWCSSTSDWAYEPGIGEYWQDAWKVCGSDGGNGGGGTGSGNTVNVSDLRAIETELTSAPSILRVKSSITTRDNELVEAVRPLNADNPVNVKRVEAILASSDWQYLFPRRAQEYSYTKFLQAIAKFPAFCADYDDGRDAESICRKALATMFAHFTQETGGHTNAWPEPQWRQGLHYIRELGWSENMANGYGLCDTSTWQGATWPCAKFPAGHSLAGQNKSYFGRGAKQLSYNYNYGPFSQAMFADVNVLLQNPDLVADTWLNLASAVFFYVYPQPPKPSMLHALDGTWQPNENDISAGLVHGFGITTQIINGGIECGGASEHIQSSNRIDYYREMAQYLAVTIDTTEVLGCANMQQFNGNGSAALNIYWEQDWNGEHRCKLVNYQTAFSAFIEGDYAKCVDHYFDVDIDYEH
ncbi:MAG: hypothetical protein HRU20_22625 [Pseudomonadales bacterium]|nr:hypothetical protein [Pseudomonadales bacterium]